ncbi:MAG TPA: gamma-glutamylcyclotransferase family protein [Hyphomonadaceae bacterium]|nr:gamma-glutamylcyclotransferase family protein [Hyphomonadaceae bacterium]
MNPLRLFTYGTLRSDVQRETPASMMAFRILQGAAVSEGIGWAKGQLYALSWYPAFVDRGMAADQVRGEVWRVHRPQAIDLLNLYEGPDYLRQLLRVTLENGRHVTAWTYKYKQSLRGVSRIASGDYLDWVRGHPEAFGMSQREQGSEHTVRRT